MTRLYVFDADGTLRRTTVPGQPCPHADGEWELIPGVRSRLARIPWGRARMAIASNQDHVEYGLVSAARCYELLVALGIAAAGVVPQVAFCPHALEVPCGCRKPAPGLLIELMERCGVRAAETLFVGDQAADEECARRAGVAFRRARDFFGA